MPFSLSAILATLVLLPMHALTQNTVPDLGILQLMTPTLHASQFPLDAIETLSVDAIDFFSSYRDIDTFNLVSAQDVALASAGHNENNLLADLDPLDHIYIVDAETSLLEDPTAYLTRLHASASPWPFSSALMSQASGILLGYESLVSRDLLSATNVPTVTPGIRINVGPGAVAKGVTATATATATAGNAGGTPSTSTSKGMGIPAATGNPQLVIAAAAAVAGVMGIIAL